MQIKAILFIIGLTLISGWADSQGFIYASNIWEGRKLIWTELGKSSISFGIGIVAYWIALKYMKELGVGSTEIQTTLWFGTTIIGIAIASGNFARWERIDQFVALATFGGMGWLLFRTGG